MTEKLQGRTALITGASSGIGADIARKLAARGANVILVARRQEALNKLAQEIRDQFGVEATVIAADLTDENARKQLYVTIEQSKTTVDILVNNAGFGVLGKFLDLDWTRVSQMLELNIAALTHITQLFIPAMVKRGWGRIMLVASTAAFQPVPNFSAYAASKSYVRSLGISLNCELAHTGVTCTTVCPGITATDFFQVAGKASSHFASYKIMSSSAVAKIATESLLAGEPIVVTGWLNTMLSFTTRFVPITWAALVAQRVLGE